MKKIIVQSHRGAGALAPENTLPSFVSTWQLGAIPEADLRTTSDGVIVAFHDENFARVVKQVAPEMRDLGVKDITWEQLSLFDVGSYAGEDFVGQRVCRIETIFGLMRDQSDRTLYMDIKNVDVAQLAHLAREFGVTRQVIFTSPKAALLREWMQRVPEGQTLLWMGILWSGTEETLSARFDTLRDEGFAGITQLQIHVQATENDGVWEYRPSLDFLHRAAGQLKARGILFQSLPWECAEIEVYRALLDAGVESFASDYPQIALQVLREQNEPLSLQEALQSARETKDLRLGEGVLPAVAPVFRMQFGEQSAVIVADTVTFELAGSEVMAVLEREGVSVREPFIFCDPHLHAEFGFVEQLEAALSQHDAIPVAVGSGVINDLTKLAAHRTLRPYMCAATAASMDGYTAFGASITDKGSKQTFNCPAPVAVVADLGIIRRAPRAMTASGYADLLAKVTAGADWLLADALGIEPVDSTAWRIVQGGLREALADPQGVANGDTQAIAKLTEGLMLGGFAMQSHKTSRPASGAEHQFSHLWDMQNHTHNGESPSHGFKVGIGALAVTALYEWLLKQPFGGLDIEKCCAEWPEKSQIGAKSRALLGEELAELGQTESEAKYVSKKELRLQLQTLQRVWPDLQTRLRAQLIPFEQLREMLSVVGAPTQSEEIGISRARLRQSYAQAAMIRRRFTVLDLALRTATLDTALDQLFGAEGAYSKSW